MCGFESWIVVFCCIEQTINDVNPIPISVCLVDAILYALITVSGDNYTRRVHRPQLIRLRSNKAHTKKNPTRDDGVVETNTTNEQQELAGALSLWIRIRDRNGKSTNKSCSKTLFHQAKTNDEYTIETEPSIVHKSIHIETKLLSTNKYENK